MEKTEKSKLLTQTKSKSMQNKSSSLTQMLCPKYRKVFNFNEPNEQQDQNISQLNSQSFNQPIVINLPIENTNFSIDKTEGLKKKHSKAISHIDINQSARIPELQERKISINVNNLSKESSTVQTSNLSHLPNLKPRKQFTSKIRSRDTSMTEEQFKLQIKDYFYNLNTIIEKTSSHFQKRMKTHEDQLLKIMMLQIKRVNEECQKTVNKYNEIIRLKASSQELDDARMEILYFKSQSLQLKKQNDELKKQIKHLKRLNNEYEIKMKTDSDTLTQMGQKLLACKEKNKNIKKSLLDQVLSKKCQNSKINQESKQHLNISTSQCTGIDGSKIIRLAKINSKSFDNNQTLGKTKVMNIKTQFASHSSSNQSLRKSLLFKLNNNINKKYKVGRSVQDYCSEISNKTPHDKNQRNGNNSHDLIEDYNRDESQINRDKILRFLKQARPSIKSIIQHKKSVDKKIPKKSPKDENNQKYYDRIKLIKNRVRLSTFQQQRWQQFKNHSMEYSMENQLTPKYQQN